MRSLAFVPAIVVGIGIAACSTGNGYTGPVDGGITGGAVGDSCDANKPCRAGLICDATQKCAPGHGSADGLPCTISAECLSGSFCGPKRTCTPAGKGKDGDSCTGDQDCVSGQRCNVVGFGAQCQPEGTVDVGGKCTKSGDCFGGLACAGGVCTPLPPNPNGPPPLGIPDWKGETCADDSGPVKAYFRVPRGTGDGDFYRLPFPNDIRMKNGKPDLAGHPSPGSGLLGFDPVDRYLRDIEAVQDGFSTYPTVILRFSGGVDFNSLKADGVVRFVDVTPNGTGADLGYGWSATTARGAYVCANGFFLRPSMGAPLEPGHTYAMLVKKGVLANGVQVVSDADFDAVVGASAPSDPALAGAYAAYKPLRDWLTAKAIAPSTLLTAAVFTTAKANALASKLPAAVAAAPAPTASGWIRCGDAPSPCPQAQGDRACGTADPAFDELHALVTLPIFQRGTAPYFEPTDGGDFEIETDGTPKLQRTEQVCMSLTVPKGTAMPPTGWPLLIYAHGTGGSFRSSVTEGIAARMASVDGTDHVAVLSIDQVQHGPRRGSSTQSPNDLFFNFANPKAARGNPVQGAADQLALLRFATTFDLAAGQSPTAAEIKFGAIAYWGHSQGATEGAIALPYAPAGTPRGVVLSGIGASLIDALLTKTSPVNIAAAVPFVLQEPSGVNGNHPVLSLLQNDIDSADPLNHARAMTLGANPPAATKNLFVPYGDKDTYSPPATEITYVYAAGMGAVQPPPSVTSPEPNITALAPKPAPYGANANVGGNIRTLVCREYTPASFDGHFVSTRDADAKKDVDHFVVDALKGTAPLVGR